MNKFKYMHMKKLFGFPTKIHQTSNWSAGWTLLLLPVAWRLGFSPQSDQSPPPKNRAETRGWSTKSMENCRVFEVEGVGFSSLRQWTDESILWTNGFYCPNMQKLWELGLRLIQYHHRIPTLVLEHRPQFCWIHVQLGSQFSQPCRIKCWALLWPKNVGRHWQWDTDGSLDPEKLWQNHLNTHGSIY